MSKSPGFFSLLAETQVRRGAVRRTSDRESRPATTVPDAGRNGSSTRIDTEEQRQRSTSDTLSVSISLSAFPLSNSDAWKLWTPGETQLQGLSDATERASKLLTRLVERENYFDSAEDMWEGICVAREQLQMLLDSAPTADEPLRFKATRTLAGIYQQLGDYDSAQTTFQSICPTMPLDRTAFDDLLAWHRIDALLAYVRFLAINARDFKQAEVFARTLPWATPDVLRTKDRRVFALMSLIQVLNGTGRHAEACEALKMLESVSGEQSSDPTYYLHKAIANSWSAEQLDAENSFAVALVLDSVLNGPWHNQTLHTTTQIGRALRAWHSHVPALAFLTLSCQALYYVLGLSHPLSIQAFKELQACKSAEPAMQRLRQFSHSQFSHKRKQSMAFEQVHLTTAIELLSPNLRINFDEITASLEQLLTTTTLNGKATFGAKRIIAWCAMEQNRFREASVALHNLHSSITDIKCDAVSAEVYRAILALDEAICFSRTRPHPGLKYIRQRSKLVYLVLNGIPPERSHQAKAILRRLTSYGLTHFTREEVFQAPPLITETNRESLGSGSSATVDTVQIRERLYARKSINYPRQVQREIRLKEDIQKEIKITYALDHPHIVRVLLTYEETKRFNIIMHPLADCDLESYLADKTCGTAQQKSLICKWIVCLTNTLAYIHSKNIRHKDIKPRNVLVKGTKVYFTDFGSGHMFSDNGNSTTDGIAYGHTRAYCAPEVIQNSDRNRASDVFSLGCILAEMAAWGSGISMSDYFSGIRAGENATDTVQYHNSTVRVRSWFEREPRLTQGAKSLFHNVVRYMIRKKPDSRLTAVEVSRVLGEEVSSDTPCIKCGIDVWVPDQ